MMAHWWNRRTTAFALAIVCAGAVNVWCLRSGRNLGALASLAAALLLGGQALEKSEGAQEQVAAGMPASAALAPPARAIALMGPARTGARNQATNRATDGAAHFPEICNAFTIDLEDYFHTEVSSRSVGYEQWDRLPSRIEATVKRLLDLLDRHETRATVFVLGWVAKKHPALIREVARRGHEIACHSYRHRPVFRLTPEEFREDTVLAKAILEDTTGAPVLGYRAPNFSITPGTEWAWTILAELGFLYDSSVNPVWHKLYANPHAPRFPYLIREANLFEIPVATWRVLGMNLPIGGGAYLRLLPLPYIRMGLSYVNDMERKPVTIYMHPWEIDCYQPELAAGWKSQIRQNWGLDTMEAKVAELLRGRRFAPIVKVHAENLPLAAPATATMGQESFARAS